MTWGLGGCIKVEETEVDMTSDSAEIRPFNRRKLHSNCTLDVPPIPHDVSITFDAPGTKTLRVYGIRVTPDRDETLEVPRTIIVQ
jgi:hypothetical protein